jgi:hypothetical protein
LQSIFETKQPSGEFAKKSPTGVAPEERNVYRVGTPKKEQSSRGAKYFKQLLASPRIPLLRSLKTP